MEYLPGYCTNSESSEWFPPLESDSSSESINNDTTSPSKMSFSDTAHENPHLTEKDSDNISKPSSTEVNIQYDNENIFACLFSIHNTISLSRHEQVCLSGQMVISVIVKYDTVPKYNSLFQKKRKMNLNY